MADDNKPPVVDVAVLRTLERYALFKRIANFLGIALLLFVGIVWPLMLTAGTETVISIFYMAVLDMRLETALPYVALAWVVLLWLRERRNRKTSIKREHDRVVELERTKDPARTSSNLEE